MNEKSKFEILVNKAMQSTHYAYMRPVVEKELLHYDILFALDKHNLLDKITFQGGTALRLCYGGQRFSEDLDFAGGLDFNKKSLINMKSCIEQYVGNRYALEVNVKEPKDLEKEPKYEGVRVDIWQIRVVTSPLRPDIPKQMIKIEVANIPAYSREPRRLNLNYDFLPDGYSDTLIIVESHNEIMADKLVAFPTCQKYIRYRDIWDLQWLIKQNAKPDAELIKHKVKDYNVENYADNVQLMLTRLHDIIHNKEFKSEMLRFIPANILDNTLHKEKFLVFLENEIRSLFEHVYQVVNGSS